MYNNIHMIHIIYMYTIECSQLGSDQHGVSAVVDLLKTRCMLNPEINLNPQSETSAKYPDRVQAVIHTERWRDSWLYGTEG